jgi:outer membrane murein-binding lipoprotein Lpp
VSGVPEDEVAVAIQVLAEQVDQLGNAVQSAAKTIAQAIERQGQPQSVRSEGISPGGTFT